MKTIPITENKGFPEKNPVDKNGKQGYNVDEFERNKLNRREKRRLVLIPAKIQIKKEK